MTHHASPDSHLVRRQQAVHDGQLGLQLGNLTVQATDRGEHSVLLVPVIQEQVVASEIPHIGLQMVDAGLKVRLLMLQTHPLNPGPPPSSDCDGTTCNKLLRISNL